MVTIKWIPCGHDNTLKMYPWKENNYIFLIIFYNLSYNFRIFLDEKSDDGGTPKKPVEKEEKEEMSEFHKLLVLRMLRPDRLHYGLSDYVAKHMPTEQQAVAYEEMKTYVSAHNLATMIVLPSSTACVHSTARIDLDVTSVLAKAAKVGIIVICVYFIYYLSF